jgi:hypothetical protein
MGFADRNSVAGKTSEVSFPDAIKRGAAAVATPFSVQITDSNGTPNDPDNGVVFVRVVNAAGTALDSRLYTDSGLSSAATNSSNATYNNGSSAFWKQVSTSGAKISIYHKTAGGDSSVEGLYNVEIAWFENGEAIARALAFRIVDAADLDTMAANIDSVLADTGALDTDWADGGRLDVILDAVLADTAIIGAPAGASLSADIAAIKTDTVAILVDTSTTLDDFIDTEAAAILADTAELQGDWTNGGRLDLILDAVLADTAVIGAAVGASISADIAAVKVDTAAILVDTSATLDDLIDTEIADILADTATLGAPAGASHAADIAAIKVDTAATLVDTATLGAPAGASHAADIAAIKVDTAATLVDTAQIGAAVGASISADIAAVKVDTAAALVDSNELQGDWTNGGRLDVILDAIVADTNELQTDNIPGTLSAISSAIAAITNNTRFVATVPPKLNRESVAISIGTYIYGAEGAMEDADSSEVFVKIGQMDGTAIAGRYYSDSGLSSAIAVESSGTFSGYYSVPRAAVGKHGFFYKNDAAHTEENLVVEFGWLENAVAVYQARTMQISDAADLDDIVADTNELQGDWTNGGRLDVILDAALADSNELQGDWTNGGRLDVILDAVLADTAELQGDWANGGRLDTIIDAIGTPAEDADAVWDEALSGHTSSGSAGFTLGSILVDTHELQGDWTDGGRLDLILDAVLADTAVLGAAVGASLSADIAAIKVDTAATLVDTATLGAPAGASHAADIAAIKVDTAAVLVDTAQIGAAVGASISADIAAVKVDTAAALADSSELQTDWANGGRLDLLLDKAAQTVHHTTLKRYLKNDATVMSADPSDDAVACSSTTQSTTYIVLDVLPVLLDEGSDATFTDVFSVLKWMHQGSGAGGGACATKWMISGASETAGSAPSGSAVVITDEVTGNTTANTSSRSGLLTTTALAALVSAGNGQLRFLLCGKVTDARDTITGKVYKSTSAEVSYQV